MEVFFKALQKKIEYLKLICVPAIYVIVFAPNRCVLAELPEPVVTLDLPLSLWDLCCGVPNIKTTKDPLAITNFDLSTVFRPISSKSLYGASAPPGYRVVMEMLDPGPGGYLYYLGLIWNMQDSTGIDRFVLAYDRDISNHIDQSRVDKGITHQ